MGWLGLIGLVLALVVVSLVLLIAVRRIMLVRAGGFDINWRLRPRGNDRGWIPGRARFRSDGLAVYRSFSLMPTPSVVFTRARLSLDGQRPPRGSEAEVLGTNVVIVTGSAAGTPLELGLTEDALTALRAWVESRPPDSRALGGIVSRDPSEPSTLH